MGTNVINERRAKAASLPAESRLVRYTASRISAAGAGVIAGIVFLALYYLTLPLCPPLRLAERHAWGGALFYDRFDLSQFVGTFFIPPYPNVTTWLAGIIILWLGLIALAVVYAVVLAWSLRESTVRRGIGIGAVAFVVLGFTITLANGIHPGVMRYAIPDVGVFLLGWSGWATLQLLFCFLVYGGVLGGLYRRWRR